jgi:hypothetical protein
MRQSNQADTYRKKQLARKQYALRKVDEFCKWSWEVRGKIKYSELVELQEYYNIKCYD